MFTTCGRQAYPDIHFNGAPENKHSGVSIFRNRDNLDHSHDRTNCCEAEESKQSNQSNLIQGSAQDPKNQDWVHVPSSYLESVF